LVEVSVHGGMLTMAGSWWGKKVITPTLFIYFEVFLVRSSDVLFIPKSVR